MKFPVPEPQWQWLLTTENTALQLQLGDGEPIQVGLQKKCLRDKNFCSGPFSVADTQLYSELLEILEFSELSENEGFLFLVIINAVAVALYHKEVAAKNWFYQSNPQDIAGDFKQYDLVSVQSKFASVDMLLLEMQGDFFNAVLLQDLTLEDTRILPIFSLIKVSSDRLFYFTGECLRQFG